MCFVSVVSAQFDPHIPPLNQQQSWSGWNPPPPNQEKKYTLAELTELLGAFRAAMAGAEAFDRITGQPDCADPEKAKLEERVAALEQQLYGGDDVPCGCP